MDSEIPKINWNNLTKALEYYTSRGYEYIEVPWIVPSDITKITFDRPEDYSFKTAYGDLVGSAEQSFLFLNHINKLPKGQFCALTPCFRSEPNITNLSRLYFMKLELIHTCDISEETLLMATLTCQCFFESLLNDNPDIVLTMDGYDIIYNGIELGSYGIRRYNDFEWIYATGIAEPRFSQALQSHGIL